MDIENQRILIIVNTLKEGTSALLEEAKSYFKERGKEVLVIPLNNNFSSGGLSDKDIAITMGGDGTLLHCARILAGADIPILGVNAGDFGFITEISKDEWIEAYEEYIAGKLEVSRRVMFNANVTREGSIIASFRGLNDAVIRSSSVSRIIRLRVFLSKTYIGRYRADGVILATPTGSTAYSMAAGGPILHPEMDAFILNPICPFTLSNRAIIIPGDESLEIEIEREQRAGIMLTIDGQDVFQLTPGDRVAVKKSSKCCLIIRSNKRNFYEVLRTKLNWAGEPNA
ncbi:MAG TPA: NAD(+)/NADH kinase [Spirochaetales bacterium]|nr:NAD(+)/NADH kinase [Spirochaetales bacterium]